MERGNANRKATIAPMRIVVSLNFLLDNIPTIEEIKIDDSTDAAMIKIQKI